MCIGWSRVRKKGDWIQEWALVTPKEILRKACSTGSDLARKCQLAPNNNEDVDKNRHFKSTEESQGVLRSQGHENLNF